MVSLLRKYVKVQNLRSRETGLFVVSLLRKLSASLPYLHLAIKNYKFQVKLATASLPAQSLAAYL